MPPLATGKSQGWRRLWVGPGVGSRRRAGPTWAPGCASPALHSRGGSGPGLWLPLYLPLNLAAMEGPQELLSGKLQLCFTPAARTSLLLLRLNDAALRALQECHQQQVRLAQAPFSLSSASPEVGPQPATPRRDLGVDSSILGLWPPHLFK